MKDLQDIIKQYATGEWICVFFTPMGMKWGKLHNPTFHVKIGSNAYKLIHKKHSDVLTHYLEGGEVKYYHPDAKEWCKDPNFIDDYDPSYSYKINNVVVGGSLEHVTDTDVGDIPKSVERITEEDAISRLDELLDCNYSTYEDIKDLVMSLVQANQKQEK